MSDPRIMAASLLQGAREFRGRPTVDLVVYVGNLDNGRGQAAAEELRALYAHERAEAADARRVLPGPALVLCMEANGNVLPHMPGMACEVGQPRSSESRGNIAVYAMSSLLAGGRIKGRWYDMRRTWPRTKYPEKGRHPARSFFVFPAGKMQVGDAHVPPRGEGTEDAREEIVDAIVSVFAPWTRPGWARLRRGQKWWRRNMPRLLGIDHNHAGEEIARRTGMRLVGSKVDALLVAGDVEVLGHRYVDAFEVPAGARHAVKVVHIDGDHKEVLRVVLRVPLKYLPTLTRRLSEVPS